MTDLEMTRLCAEAMGIEGHPVRDGQEMWSPEGWEKNKDAIITHCWPFQIWNPLHDDAQAMALVKKHRLGIMAEDAEGDKPAGWFVTDGRHDGHGGLNRAIVECVAKMQAAEIEDKYHGDNPYGSTTGEWESGVSGVSSDNP